MQYNLVSGLKKYKSLDSRFQEDSFMVIAGWQVMCLWPLLREDTREVLGICWGWADSVMSLRYTASVSTAQAGLFFTLTADDGLDVYIISLRHRCNGNGKVPPLGWQIPQRNNVNISQAKWNEMGEVEGTVLEMVLVMERWLFFGLWLKIFFIELI